MGRTIVYYITGHGFGHARRSARVIREMLACDPDLHVHIRSTVAPEVLSDTLGPRAVHESAGLDPGAVEDGALAINVARTAQRVREAIASRDSIVADELRAMPRGTRLIVADVPFLAGDVARAAQLPCIALTNFTWDWIYEPWFSGDAAGRELLEQIQASYSNMEAILKLPFGGRTDMFRQVVEVPLIVSRGVRPRDQARQQIGVNGHPARPVVLIGQRGGIDPLVLDRAARSAPEMLFLCPGQVPAAGPANLLAVRPGPELPFADILAASDAVVSKLGYGTVADCIGSSIPILWPPRVGFREDRVMLEEATLYMRQRQIGLDRFAAGDWGEDLRALLDSPPPLRRIGTDGDSVCAQWILERI